jgi:hypothetical protein
MTSPLVEVCLKYGKTGKVPEKLIKSYLKEIENN